MIKIVFTLPNHVPISTTRAWESYTQVMSVYPAHVISRGAEIGHVRNAAITHSNSKRQDDFDFDKILYVDADISFTEADIARLVAIDVPVIAGVYYTAPGQLSCGGWRGVRGNCNHFPHPTAGVVEVQWSGAGFILLDRAVFATTPYPWWRHYMVETGAHACETSEDVGLCMHLADHGYSVTVDMGTVLRHHKIGCERVC